MKPLQRVSGQGSRGPFDYFVRDRSREDALHLGIYVLANGVPARDVAVPAKELEQRPLRRWWWKMTGR